MDHYLLLVLTEVLDGVALTGIAIKGQNHKFLEKFVFQCGHREGRIGYINGDGPESAMMRYTHFFDSL